MAKNKNTATGEPKILITQDPLIRCALNALPSPDPEIRDGVSCGEHEVDFVVRVRGELKVGPDTLTHQVNKFQLWSLVKILGGKMSDELFTKCLDEALVAAVAGTEIEGSDEIKERVAAAVEQAMPAVSIVRKGSVRFTGRVEIVDG